MLQCRYNVLPCGRPKCLIAECRAPCANLNPAMVSDVLCSEQCRRKYTGTSGGLQRRLVDLRDKGVCAKSAVQQTVTEKT